MWEVDSRGGAPYQQKERHSPWSSASEKRIDSLADWLIPTLGRPDDFTYFTYIYIYIYFADDCQLKHKRNTLL